ncbi:MAG: biotin--[acetyl-CoA-carboxylase] ligase, partial [Proteobacteria bacterium]|nr:biotin--[acetyl-CoA-carboxylase] ligase [Pseudomonadota bacterium]
MGERGSIHGSVVWARSQTEGRGRYSRKWESPEGNLYLSILLRPPVDLVHFSQLSFVMAVAARDAVLKATGAKTQFKWPNDLLLNKKKCGGILLETSMFSEKKQWVVCGIGINMQFSPEIA